MSTGGEMLVHELEPIVVQNTFSGANGSSENPSRTA